MPQYKYKLSTLNLTIGYGYYNGETYFFTEGIDNWLNAHGKDGWILSCVNADTYYWYKEIKQEAGNVD